MNSKLIKKILVAGLALVGLMASGAFAQTAQTSFQVSATVNKNCNVTANNLTFATPYDGSSGTPNDSTTTIGVRCTKNTPYTVALDAGTVTGTSFAARKMANATPDYMNYNLYTDGTYGTVWGDGTASTATVAGTGAGMGTLQNLTVYGRIPISQNLEPGTYTEPTIMVTVTY